MAWSINFECYQQTLFHVHRIYISNFVCFDTNHDFTKLQNYYWGPIAQMCLDIQRQNMPIT